MNQSGIRRPTIYPPEKSANATLTHLREVIAHAAHLLPSQGPITVFIHHNTLHAFEDLPFEKAVEKGARLFGCQPYLTEDAYRQELLRGVIRFADVQEVLREDLHERADERILGLCSRFELRWAMLQYPLRSGPLEELLWHIAETDALRRVRAEASSAVREQFIAETRRWVMRDLRGQTRSEKKEPSKKRVQRLPLILRGLFQQFKESAIDSWSDDDWEEFALRALWAVCCHGVTDVPSFASQPATPIRHRDLLLAATGEDADQPVHELLIRFCAAFLDQGLAQWPLPRREEGFFRAFSALYRQPGGPPERWRAGLENELRRLEDERVGPLESIHESLRILGVAEEEWPNFLAATLLALRGWAGLLEQISRRGDRVVRPVPEDSLQEFLAVRLILDRLSLANTARDALGFTGPLSGLREELRRLHLSSEYRLLSSESAGSSELRTQNSELRTQPGVEQRAFTVFQLAQVLGWTPECLHRLNDQEWWTLLQEIETVSVMERQRIFHLAYERRICTRVLDAIALHAPQPDPTPRRPRFQAVFCIDERMESLRRHLEELAPEAETFAAAGFFGVPMYYRGAADAHFVPLCPAVMQPRHWVVEQVVEQLEETHQRRAWTRRVLGLISHRLHVGSRTFAVGALIAGVGGVLASIPLVARVLAPRWTSLFRRRLGRFVQTPPVTRMRLERKEESPLVGEGGGGGVIGFTLDEMTDIAERVLRDIGLTANFARLVLFLGHGSTSLNNPHESAYDCGACGGSRGGPNARALAQILNDPRIREQLQTRGLPIPAETVFLGGLYNTSCEAIAFDDLDLLPPSHQHEFAEVRALLEQAGDRNAHERCRRFDSAPLSLAAARQHVEGRAEDLAQVRAEWGHATNAFSLIGRRSWSRGLFLDRRAFLTSYDPTQDDADSTILTRVLQAVLPVCAGINLEYYFSRVDNTGWGCGTKLPHNITGLLGVMDGAASDLRTGLPWQMVEGHKPVRLLNIVETTPEAMQGILERNEDIGRLCRNGWVHLAVLHPQTRRISVYRNGRFQPYTPRQTSLPRAASSLDWYHGCRDHLEFAQIEPISPTANGAE